MPWESCKASIHGPAIFTEPRKTSSSSRRDVQYASKINGWIERHGSVSHQVYSSWNAVIALRGKVNRGCQAILVSLVVVSVKSL